jgi:ABC-type uncharacterized transport system auxiliary subunit
MTAKYPDQHKYMLHIRKPAKLVKYPSRKVILIGNTTIEPQFSNLDFVYRIDNINYRNDYYNVFFIQPSMLINQAIAQYINATNLFRYTTEDTHPININYFLKSHVTALYADYRNKNFPKAVITIHFTLFHFIGQHVKLLMNKTLTAAIPLQQKDSPSLVYAWNRGLTIILQQLAKKVSSLIF